MKSRILAAVGATVLFAAFAVPVSATAADADSIPVYSVSGGQGLGVYLTLPGIDEPVLVHLDTGSAGLIISGDQVDTAAMTDLNASFSQDYVGHSVLGEMYSAPVTIGGATSAAVPIGVEESIQCANGTTCWPFPGTVGTLGIGQGYDQVGTSGVFLGSPLASIEGGAGDGFTLTLSDEPAAAGTDGLAPWGTLALARPAGVGADSTVCVPKAAPAQTYPNGNPVFVRRVSVAWTLGGANQTNATTFDTGAPSGFVSGATFAASANGDRIAAGTTVVLSAPEPSATCSADFDAWSVGPGAELSWQADAQTGFSDFNTGLQFFVGRTVAYDGVDGHVRVSADPRQPDTAAANTTVVATAEDQAAVSWQKPASIVGLPHGGYTVTATPVATAAPVGALAPARAAAPTVTATVGPTVRSVVLGGLVADTSYDVSVTVFNSFGSGPPATVRIRTLAAGSAPLPIALAETGAPVAAMPVFGGAVLLAAGLGLVLVRRRRRAS